MQGGNNNRNGKKNGTPWVPIVIMLLAAVMGGIDDGYSLGIIVVVGLCVVVFLAAALSNAAKKKAADAAGGTRRFSDAAGQAPVPVREMKRSLTEFTPKQFSIFTKDATLEEMSFSNRRMETTCEYGDMNHIFSHDQSQRLKQLDFFLKNGIIEREEYNILRKRYLNPVEYR